MITTEEHQLVVRERRGPHVAVLRIDSPPRNAFGRPECLAFITEFEALQADPEIRCVIVTGTGKSFLAGADLRAQRQLTESDHEAYVDSDEGLSSIMRRIENARFPVIAAINGFVLGGGLEFALCCDIRIGSTDARFVCSGVNVGLILSWFRLPRVIGMGRAKEMLFSGAMYDAERAERWGLISALYEPDRLMAEAEGLADQIASRAPLSVEATKGCANRAFDVSTEEAMILQREKFLQMIRTEDHHEALDAFLAKRPAVYTRR